MWLSKREAYVVDEFHKLYFRGFDGVPLYMTTTYLGVATCKCPLDLWVYQEIIHRTRPEVIVECGVYQGGTTLYLANLCDHLGTGTILACDIDLQHVHPQVLAHPRITLLQGSSTDPSIHVVIEDRCRGRTTMVILDSDHTGSHVAQELRLYAPLVSRGHYLICEDTNLNGHPVLPFYGEGPHEAVGGFLADHPGWEADAHCERLLLSFNPRGYLRRPRRMFI